MKNLLLIFFLSLSTVSYSQIDSSKIFSGMLTGGNSKSWYTRPGIIDNLKQTHYSTLTFKLKTKTGSLNKSGAGRDIKF